MNEKLSQIGCYSIGIIVTGVICYLLFSSAKSPNEGNIERQTIETEDSTLFVQMLQNYPKFITWSELYKDDTSFYMPLFGIFSLIIQQRLDSCSSIPILFKASIRDIKKEHESYVALFESDGTDSVHSFEGQLEMICDSTRAIELMRYGRYSQHYLLTKSIRAYRARFEVTAKAWLEEYESYTEPNSEILLGIPELTILRGTIIESVPVSYKSEIIK